MWPCVSHRIVLTSKGTESRDKIQIFLTNWVVLGLTKKMYWIKVWTPAKIAIMTSDKEQSGSGLAMSNQRSFKIGSLRFSAFVPKKIECKRFWIKILDRNKTPSISSKIFLTKSNHFVLSFKNPGAIWNILVLVIKIQNKTKCFSNVLLNCSIKCNVLLRNYKPKA